MDNYYKDDLKTSNWLGEVVDVDDPLFLGRVKVKVFGKFDDLETEDIPWANPSNNFSPGDSSGGGSFKIPKLGCIVNIQFDNGNLYCPEYTFNQKISDSLKSEIEGDYEGAWSEIFDEDELLKIYYVRGKGLTISLKESFVNILNDNESIQITTPGTFITTSEDDTVNNAPKIYLGSDDAEEPLLFGNKTDDWLNEMLDIMAEMLTVLGTHKHTTPAGPTITVIEQPQFDPQVKSLITKLRSKIVQLKSKRNFTK